MTTHAQCTDENCHLHCDPEHEINKAARAKCRRAKLSAEKVRVANEKAAAEQVDNDRPRPPAFDGIDYVQDVIDEAELTTLLAADHAGV